MKKHKGEKESRSGAGPDAAIDACYGRIRDILASARADVARTVDTTQRLAEAQIRQAIVDNMEAFLSEMGHGFTYVNRQQRITVDGDHFYVDLVLYHTKLKCHVVVELKCGKFEPRDLGQLQFYVNYYDAERRQPDENPTLGLLLCADKNEAVARYTIGSQNQRLFASRYLTQLPTEKQLQERIASQLRAMSLAALRPRTHGAPRCRPRRDRADLRRNAPVSNRAGSHGAPAVLRDQGSPVADGNKRIGTFLFLEYLRRHGLLELPDPGHRVNLRIDSPRLLNLLVGATKGARGSDT